MPFIAECPFCKLMLRGVPDDRIGSSKECPKCHSLFTLAAMLAPRAQGLRKKRRSQEDQTAGGGSLAPAVLDLPGQEARIETPISVQIQTIYANEAAGHIPAVTLAEQSSTGSAKALRWIGLASLILATLAIVSASVPILDKAVLPLAGTGLLLGAAGWISLTVKRRAGVILSALGTTINLPILVLGWAWPGLISPPSLGDYHPPVLSQAELQAVDLRTDAPGSPLLVGEWVDASRWAIRHGDMRISIASVSVKPAELKKGKTKEETKSKHLLIELRIKNLGTEHGRDYASWGSEDVVNRELAARLKDNTGKTYALSFGPITDILGHVPWAWIAPAREASDLLVFDAPSPQIEHLNLELSASAYGNSGTLHLKIPKAMIRFR